MQYNDDKLIQLTLEGDHDAFAVLVEKYQSQIHALAPTDFLMNFHRCGLNP